MTLHRAAPEVHPDGSPHSNGDGKRRKPKPLTDLESARWAWRVARTREQLPPDIAGRMPPDWVDACLVVAEDGPAAFKHWLAILSVRLRANRPQFESMRAALKEAEDEGPDDAPPRESGPAPFRLNPIGAVALNRAVYRMSWLVERILVGLQPCVVGAPKKSMKTSVMVELAIALASARDFLGEFRVPEAVPVLLLSGESGGFVIQETVRRICRAKEIEVESLEGKLYVEYKLPQLGVSEHLDELTRVIREYDIKAVIIDPLYLCLLSGIPGKKLDAGNLFDMGPLLLAIAQVCLEAGATPLLVHHFKKTGADPYELPELEELAYAGIQEFARQWMLLKRRERYKPGTGEHRLWLSVGGSAGHSGEWSLDVSEGAMDVNFKGREWNVSVKSATDAYSETAEQRKADREKKVAEREQLKSVEKETKERVAVGEITAILARQPDRRATAGKLRSACGWGKERVERTLYLMEQEGKVRSVQFAVATGKGAERQCDGFELIGDGRMEA